MNDGKGKGRASNPDDSGQPPSDNQLPYAATSVLGAVTASITGLAHSVLAVPTNNEVSNAASVALESTGKNRELGGRSDSWAESSSANQQNRQADPHGSFLPSIRTYQGEEHIRDTEAEFSTFLDGIDSFTPSSAPESNAGLSLGQEIEEPLDRFGGRIDNSHFQSGQILYNAVDEQQKHDGDAVLSILSHPFSAIDEAESSPKEDEAVHWGLTEQQLLQLQKITGELFPAPDQHMSVSAQHPLNLNPDMVSIRTSSASIPTIGVPLHESSMLIGQNVTPDEARQIWMDQWEGVLTRYTDEVWGNLLPLVIEAREDIKAMKDDGTGTMADQSRALRRLKLVLDHVRKL